jgi:molybdopterin converting factor small subunit
VKGKIMSEETIETLGEALPREMARVRDKVMPLYQAIGPAGAFALMMMRKDLDDAARALAEGDVVAMLRVYESLKETHA